MRLPAALCKMQRKKRETDGFSKSTWMTPPGSHPTSGFGARHGLPKFFRHKKRRIVQNDAAIGGPRGIRTLDLSDANRTLSQLSYRPIFVFQNENSVTLLERFVKDFSPGRPAGNGRVDLPFLKNGRSFIAVCVFNAQATAANCISQRCRFDRHYF